MTESELKCDLIRDLRKMRQTAERVFARIALARNGDPKKLRKWYVRKRELIALMDLLLGW